MDVSWNWVFRTARGSAGVRPNVPARLRSGSAHLTDRDGPGGLAARRATGYGPRDGWLHRVTDRHACDRGDPCHSLSDSGFGKKCFRPFPFCSCSQLLPTCWTGVTCLMLVTCHCCCMSVGACQGLKRVQDTQKEAQTRLYCQQTKTRAVATDRHRERSASLG